MLSKLAAYAEASVDEDFSVDVFESVMDHTFKTFLSESEPKIPREAKKPLIIGQRTGEDGCNNRKCWIRIPNWPSSSCFVSECPFDFFKVGLFPNAWKTKLLANLIHELIPSLLNSNCWCVFESLAVATATMISTNFLWFPTHLYNVSLSNFFHAFLPSSTTIW